MVTILTGEVRAVRASFYLTRDDAIRHGLRREASRDDVARIAGALYQEAFEDGVILRGVLTQVFLWRAQMRREKLREIIRQEIAAIR